MTRVTSDNPLIDQVLAGENRQLQLLAADGVVPLPPEELLPLQVALAQNEDAEVSERAAASLTRHEPRFVGSFIREEADAEALAYFARTARHPVVLEAILRRRDVAHELLMELAPKLDPELQEVLLVRQDAILEEPSILDALASNPRLSPYSRRRIGEYRDHLLPREEEEEPIAGVEEGLEEATDEEVQEAIEQARQLPPEGEREETTELTEAQIRALPIPVRLKLSRGAARTLRGILIRDPTTMVAISVLENNALSDQEVEQIAHNRLVIDDVLVKISRQRQWMSKYAIVHALVQNPRLPVGVAMRLLPRLSLRDLRNMSRNRNVAEPVRQAAGRFYKMKGS